MRKVAISIWLTLLSGGLIALFWYNEWIYSLPTPVPDHYKTVNPGSTIDAVRNIKSPHKPLFLHFFNPDCPCSRFNITHFKSLVKQYGSEVTFAVVVMSKKNFTAKEIQDKFSLTIPVIFDSAIASQCGVYSTPQAVIIDTSNKLYYRGNYNKSRYCTDKKTNYAQIALDGLLHNNLTTVFDQYALKAYGCQLPTCTK